ncbi:MAG TPA: adenylate kinase [Acholeplasmataceae bacterium]|jgi:adenylate kinase|nr:adenylate kinase [Acholeplasmataceae bacterium]HQC30739.1 adenylate kinase [Acholeplasmataceae bacterium]
MIVILLGAPGAGKGTQAELLVKRYQIPHIATGDIFREHFKKETPIGKLAKEYIDKGQLVPDQLTNDIVRDRLSQKDAQKGFILDGYPRNLFQARALDQLIERHGWKVTAVININPPVEILVNRISGRRICSKCGAVYHVTNKKPKVEGICDVCGGSIIQRKDDNAEVVLKRLEVYENQTKELIDYYRNQGILHDVSGLEIKKTDEEVVQILGE